MKSDKELLEYFEANMKDICLGERVKQLYEPIEYTLAPGGKRLRPLLCLRACEAECAQASKAINQAMAVEMFHNFTLIHDDVMDNSDTRRGRPTVFARWRSTQAILSGDALLTLASQRAVDGCDAQNFKELMSVFNRTALEVYEGQQLDMDFEDRDDVTADEYIEMIRLKTSVLLGCACAMGALAAGNENKSVASDLYGYGESLGLAFQLRDDWLDTFGDAEEFGKPIGGDILNRKKTWLFITAMSEAPSQMARALDMPESELVGAVTKVYNQLNLSDRCNAMIEAYCADAIKCVERADIPNDSREWFVDLAKRLCTRSR